MILAGGGGDPSFAFLHIYVGALNVLNWSPAALWEWTQASVGRWVLATGMGMLVVVLFLTFHTSYKFFYIFYSSCFFLGLFLCPWVFV